MCWGHFKYLKPKIFNKIKFQHVTDVLRKERKRAPRLLHIHTSLQEWRYDEGLSSGKTLVYINASVTPNCQWIGHIPFGRHLRGAEELRFTWVTLTGGKRGCHGTGLTCSSKLALDALNVSRCVDTDAAGISLPFGDLVGKTWNYWNWNRLISACSCCSNTSTVSAWKIRRRLEEKSHKVNKRRGRM